MSLSEAPKPKITFFTPQTISDEILGAAIRFCRETGHKQNILLLTFFWNTFLFYSKNELDEHRLLQDVMNCYIHSLSTVFPKVKEDGNLKEQVAGMQQQYWNNISTDFTNLRSGEEIAKLLEIASSLNSQGGMKSGNSIKPDSQKNFSQVCNSVDSSVYQIIHDIDNGFGIKNRYILDEFRFTQSCQSPSVKNAPARKPTVEPKAKTSQSNNAKSLGMAWYEFLIYFGLIAGAIFNIIYSFGYMSGSIYFTQTNGQVSAEDIYAFYGMGLKVIDILYGFALMGYAVFAIILRSKLANYKPEAIRYVNIFYALLAGVPFVYSVIVALITSEPLAGQAVGSLIVGLVFFFLNRKYFKKRKHLFMTKKPSNTITPPPVVQKVSAPTVTNEQKVPTTQQANTPKNQINIAEETSDKLGNYAIIKKHLASGFVDNARSIVKKQIEKSFSDYELTRKTDLMKIVFGNISNKFAKAHGPKTDLVVCAYYQIAFDEILAHCNDMNDLIFSYSATKATGIVGSDIHKYLQMIVKIQLAIDSAIATSKSAETFMGHAKNLHTKVFSELNSYIDDKTDWNKL